MKNAADLLVSIRQFARAGVAMGKVHVERERRLFVDTNHSCYTEGWAAGYLAAMATVEQFIEDTVGDRREP